MADQMPEKRIEMSRSEFNRRLADIGVSKREFAELAGLSYATVNNWGTPSKGVPRWVRSWLENFEKARAFDAVSAIVVGPECALGALPP